LVISRASATWLFLLVLGRVARSSLPKALLLPNLLSPGGTEPSAPGERCAPKAKHVASLVGCAHLRPANVRPFLGHKSGKLSLSPTGCVSVSSRSLKSENNWGFHAVGRHSGPSGWPVVDGCRPSQAGWLYKLPLRCSVKASAPGGCKLVRPRDGVNSSVPREGFLNSLTC
jgi:hypothetical protein